MFVDVTQEVDRRVAHNCGPAPFHGHVWRNDGTTLKSDTAHRPQDLRVDRSAGSGGDDTGVLSPSSLP